MYHFDASMHTSGTCSVHEVRKAGQRRQKFVLKAMKHAEQYERELLRRGWFYDHGSEQWTPPTADKALDPHFIVGIEAQHSGSFAESAVRVDAALRPQHCPF